MALPANHQVVPAPVAACASRRWVPCMVPPSQQRHGPTLLASLQFWRGSEIGVRRPSPSWSREALSVSEAGFSGYRFGVVMPRTTTLSKTPRLALPRKRSHLGSRSGALIVVRLPPIQNSSGQPGLEPHLSGDWRAGDCRKLALSLARSGNSTSSQALSTTRNERGPSKAT